MSKIFVILGALLFVQLAACRVVREAPRQDTVSTLPAMPTTLDEFLKQAEAALNTANKNLLEAIGVKSNAELNEKIQGEVKKGAETLQTSFQTLRDKVDNKDTRKFFDNVQAQLEGLIKDDPKLTADGKKLAEHFTASASRIQTETAKLATRLQQEGQKIAPEVQKLLEQTADKVTTVAKNVVAEAKKVNA